jgi:predicted DNA-binding ribbon-helix-helix protein
VEDFEKVTGDVSTIAGVRHRIVQHGRRRYSIKLEAGFWRCLEECAHRRGMRLNHLVGALASRHPDALGFAASLRLFCLRETAQRLAAAEAEAKSLALATGATDLGAIVNACPSPCLVLSYDRTITLANEPFARWLSIDVGSLAGKPIEHFFQIRGHFRLDDLWSRFGRGLVKAMPAKLAYVAPGRVVVAKANLCAAAVKGPNDFSCLVLLDLLPQR